MSETETPKPAALASKPTSEDEKEAPVEDIPSQMRSERNTLSSISTSTSESIMPARPPNDDQQDQDDSVQTVDSAGKEDVADNYDSDEDEDDEFAIKGVWYTNDAGEDILLSEA